MKVYSYDELPLTVSVEELMPILGIGRNSAYELVRSGRLRSVRVGRKLRIPKESVMDFLRNSSRSHI